MIEIFSHDLSVSPDPDASEVLIISGRGWENEPFELYLKKEMAVDLIWQMSYYIHSPEDEI